MKLPPFASTANSRAAGIRSRPPGWLDIQALRKHVALRLALGLILLEVALASAVGLFSERGEPVGSGDVQGMRAQGIALLRSLSWELRSDDRDGAREAARGWLSDDPRIILIQIKAGEESIVHVDRPRDDLSSHNDGAVVNVQVKFRRDNRDWAVGEVDFSQEERPWWQVRPWALQAITASSLGLLLAFLYLRRALVDLDPNAVVPERVRNAFDLLAQGVLLFDVQGRIVLANEAFLNYVGGDDALLVGRPLNSIAWLSLGTEGEQLWKECLEPTALVRDRPLDACNARGEAMKLLVSGGPIPDHQGRVRGGVLNFNDVSAVDKLNSELQGAVEELALSNAKIEAQNRQLTGLATLDGLTGAINRRGFDSDVAQTLRELQRVGRSVSLVMVDIDHFKSVNDRFGHLVGDDVIKRLAATLRAVLAKGQLLIRYGGEEFCVLLPDMASDEAMLTAEHLRSAVESGCVIEISDHGRLSVTASFGVSTARDADDTLQSLVSRADAALYVAKREGRNRVQSESQSADGGPLP